MKDDWKRLAGSVHIAPGDARLDLMAAKIQQMTQEHVTLLKQSLFADYAQGRPMTRRERVAEWWGFSRVRRYLLTLWDAVRGRIDYYDYE